MPKIHFIDVTNRDGAQTARISLAKLQKTMINMYLAQIGIHQSEMGFPFVRHEYNYIKANLELQELGAMGSLVLAGWCRAIVADVEASLPTGLKDLNLSISTSDQMITYKFRGRLDRGQVIQEMVDAVACAKKGGIRTIGVNAEDASRTDPGYLREFAQAARDAGAHRIRYCDTVGCDSPFTIYERVKELAEAVKLPIELHCHDDLGMSVANSLAGAKGAVDGGVDVYINTTVNGIGERAGQADLLSCLLALEFAEGLKDYEVGDPINLTVAWKLANYVAYAFDVPIAINQVGVGANAFTHESGIHVDGIIKDPRNYELYDFTLLGRLSEERPLEGAVRIITTGEYGGMAGFKYIYSRLGITFPDDNKAQEILELVQYANAHTQVPLLDDELRFIATYPEQVKKILTVIPGVR
ncbi:MAG: homocitrate synthase [Chloroflexi bacterium]|nr:homocitrate synthase [Chloroflexota bacterium]